MIPCVRYKIDANIVMPGQIEKKNYALWTGVTMNHATSREDLTFLPDSIVSCWVLMILKIRKQVIDFFVRDVIFLSTNWYPKDRA